MKKWLLGALCALLIPFNALAASCTSYPFTLQNNTTADATQVMANFNTVRNCVINNAAGSGANTDITSLLGLTTPLAPGSGGSSVFIGTTSTGTANAQVVSSTTPTGFSLTNGYRVTFTAGATNTAAATLNVNSSGATAINRVGHAGLEALTGGEMVAGNIIEAIYNGSVFVLLSTDLSGVGQRISIAGAATIDLGTVATHNAAITGSGATITSFGSSAVVTDPIYLVVFGGANTLTYNATSMIIPGAANITTAQNDAAVVEYLGSGNWQVLSYTKISGANVVATTPLCGALGLTITNNSGTPNTNIDYAATQAVMLTSAGVSFTAALSGTINTTNVGVIDGIQAARANSTFYKLYALSNGTTSGMFAVAQGTALSAPSGYTYSCYLGSMVTDSSGNFLRTGQNGNLTTYRVTVATNTNALPPLGSGSTAGYPALVSVSWASVAPATANMLMLVPMAYGNSAGVQVAPTANYNSTASSSNPPPCSLTLGSSGYASTAVTLPCNIIPEASTLQWASTGASNILSIYGWKDAVNAN